MDHKNRALSLRVVDGGRPLPGIQIYRQHSGSWEPAGRANEAGRMAWKVDPDIFPLTLLLKAPSGYWDRYIRVPRPDLDVEVGLEPLAWHGPLGWWHSSLGPSAGLDGSGAGIRVGVVDTGFGPSQCLDHVVGIGAWIDGEFLPGPSAARDMSNHGTHVTGLLAARSCGRLAYAGVAPGVSAFVVRVFGGDAPAGSDDIASAIEQLVEKYKVHLINLSLGSDASSEDEQSAIQYALDHGALVLASAGNDGGAINYPAAYGEAVAVGAVGKLGEGSDFARAESYVANRDDLMSDDGIYIADFSSHGPGLCCVAPGVDMISTVPSLPLDDCPLAGMCGTSMASPIVCGALAIRLANDSEYLEMEPTRQRSEKARHLLEISCRDLGCERSRQGFGLPTVR